MFKTFRKMKKPSFCRLLGATVLVLFLAVVSTAVIFGIDTGLLWITEHLMF